MYNEVILKNNMRVIFAPLEGTKAVTILILVPVGSRYESKGNNGVSHFIEHLMFKGTKKRPSTLDISKELDGVGANYNAFTGKDHTGYYIKISADKLELGLDILSDILFNSTFKKDEIDRERGVILEEIKMYKDNPLMYIDDLFEQTIYKGNPLGWSIAGPPEVIQKISREDIVKFKNKFYRSDNILLTLAGQFDEKKAIKLINTYFGRQKGLDNKTSRNFLRFRVQPHKLPQITIYPQKTKQMQIILGFPAYPYSHSQIYASVLLSIILGGNMSSRLFVNVRERKGLVYYIKAGVGTYQDTGEFTIQAGVDGSNLFKAIKIILAELKKIKLKGVSVAELKRSQEFIKGKLTLALEDSAGIAEWYGKQRLFMDETLTPDEKIKKYFKVTTKQIQQVAKDIIKQNQMSFALIGSFNNKKDLLKILRI